MAADAHDAARVPEFQPTALQLMLMLGPGISAKSIAADAHDAGRVPEFWPTALQMMLMMLAGSRSFGHKQCC